MATVEDRRPSTASRRRDADAPSAAVACRDRARGLGGIAAVGVKELRGRMRGRRAFVILTIYLLLLGGFAWMVELLMERSYASRVRRLGGVRVGARSARASSPRC